MKRVTLSPKLQAILAGEYAARSAGSSHVYTISLLLTVPGTVPVTVIRQAVDVMQSRHEALRARLAPEHDAIVVRERGDGLLELPGQYVEPRAELSRLAPLDLEKGLSRAVWASATEPGGLLLFQLHHVVGDAASVSVIHQEIDGIIRHLLRGDEPPTAPTSALLPDDAPIPAALEQAVREFAEAAAASDGPVRLPYRQLPTAPHGRVTSSEVTFEQDDVVRLEKFCNARHCSLSGLIVSAFALVLMRASGQRSAVFVMAAANRATQDRERAVGALLTLVPFVVTRDESQPAGEYLTQTQLALWSALERQEVDLFDLRDRLPWQAAAGLHVVINDVSAFTAPSDSLTERVADPDAHARFDLTLQIEASGNGGLRLSLQTPDGAVRHEVREALGQRLRLTINAMTVPGDAPIQDIPVLSQLDREHLDALRARRPAAEQAPDVWAEVQRHVARRPSATAIVDGGEVITYDHLRTRVLGFAAAIDESTAPGPVCIVLPRSVDAVVAMLAAIVVGRPFVPIDPSWPPGRIQSAVDSSGATAIVTERDGLRARQGASEWASSDAYWIHTSGSTGTPKAVAVPRRSLNQVSAWYVRTFGLGPRDRCTWSAGTGFDASILEVVPTLAAGAQVIVVSDEERSVPADFLALLDRHQVTTTFLVTPLLLELIRANQPWPTSLRRVQTGGERLPDGLPTLPFQLSNLYGPTESAIVTTYKVGPDEGSAIGTPRDGVGICVVDDMLREQPVEAVGELCVSGPFLADRYVGAPGSTARGFVPATADPAPGARMYRTGDRVRLSVDGELHYLGRIDRQVKIRGHRIELGDVESAIRQWHPVRDCIVLADSDGLRAYVCADDTALDVGGLRAHLRTLLPRPAIPRTFQVMTTFPIGAGGKVDVSRLPVPAESVLARFVPPTGPVQELVAAAFASALPGRKLSADDDFFAAGGDSLHAVAACRRLDADLGLHVPVSLLFDHPSIRDLAGAVEELILSAAAKTGETVPVASEGKL